MMSTEMLRAKASEALMLYLAQVIRTDTGEDPDHSGPEDAAEAIAEKLIIDGYALAMDWRTFLD
jgi:hypothetical protein